MPSWSIMASTTSKPSTAIFGASDGLIAAIALVLVFQNQGQKAVLLALFGLLVAEGLGMAASQYLADPEVSLRQATIMGASTGAAIFLVGLPWIFFHGTGATAASVALSMCVAALISWIRPGGWQGWAQTFGILVAVSTIAAATGHLT